MANSENSCKRPHQTGFRRYVRKHYAIPPEHGAWVWWIGPLIVGAAAGGTLHADFFVLIFTALAAFLVRQPLTLLVKVLSGLRPASDRAPALFWTAIHGSVCAAGAAGLVALDHARVLLLGLLAAPLLLWYFFLVSRKSERHQRGMEYATAAVLALALPAAYWVCGGTGSIEPWILWGLVTLHSVTTVIHVSKILELRRTKRMRDRRYARRVLALTLPFATVCAIAAGICATMGVVSWLAIAAFLVPIADIAQSAIRPPVGIKPTQLGLRQLATSSVFVVLMAIAVVL